MMGVFLYKHFVPKGTPEFCRSIVIVTLFFSTAFPQHYILKQNNEIIHITSGLGGSAVSLILKHYATPLSVDDINSLDKNSINTFDRGATAYWNTSAGMLSDAGLAFTFISPAVLMLGAAGRDETLTIGTMYFETMLYATALNQITKAIVLRNRPFTYNPNAPLGDKQSTDARMSFYSGHTTTAFASAVFLSTVFCEIYPRSEWKPAVIGLSLASAAATGYFRYKAGMHFPTDIIVAAVIGSTIGYIIPQIHKTSAGEGYSKAVPVSTPVSIGFSYRF